MCAGLITIYVCDKKFGKNFIDYKVRNNETKEIINEGKCGNFTVISKIYKSLIDQYGKENVRLLSR